MKKEIFKKIRGIVDLLPHVPGVYQMKNTDGNTIYVGKAKDLRKRVSQYFQKDYAHSSRTKKLLENVAGLEYIQTDTELEAYVLETNLIKEIKPKYNVVMKDDKNFSYLKIILNEDFPRIRVVRKIENDGAKYIGPKTNTEKIYETFRVLKKILPFRHCQLDIAEKESAPGHVEVKNRVIDYPCLDYFIKRCPGPCIGAISSVEYKKIVHDIIHFLEGRGEEVIKKLKNDMLAAAAEKKFEQAARLRDKLLAVESVFEKQKVSDPERKNTDVINFVIEMGRAFVCLFRIRAGKLMDKENFILDSLELPKDASTDEEIEEAFLRHYYGKVEDYPAEIFLPFELADRELFQEWLSREKGKKVKILTPQKGEKNKLLELCRKNAEQYAKQCRVKWMAKEAQKDVLKELAISLELPISEKGLLLQRIECYDISHTGGQDTVGSMVVFENGYAKPEHYRHFKLRTIQNKPDDFSSMKEVLERRLKYLEVQEDKTISYKSANKKDLAWIEKSLKEQHRDIANLAAKNFMVAKKKNEIIGYGRIHALNDNVSILSGLWVTPKERGKKLGYNISKRLIERSKMKRIYLDCSKNLESYYAVFGFTVLKQAPEILLKRLARRIKELKRDGIKIAKKDMVFMMYDKTKHKIDPSFLARPDLIMVDGGKPQLTAALEALKSSSMNIPVIALAKRLEAVYLPEKEAPYLFEESAEALKLLQRIRDEAHRFAITYGRELHRKNIYIGAQGGLGRTSRQY